MIKITVNRNVVYKISASTCFRYKSSVDIILNVSCSIPQSVKSGKLEYRLRNIVRLAPCCINSISNPSTDSR